MKELIYDREDCFKFANGNTLELTYQEDNGHWVSKCVYTHTDDAVLKIFKVEVYKIKDEMGFKDGLMVVMGDKLYG